MCYELKLFEDTTIIFKVNYSPDCQVPDTENPIPRWLTHIDIESEREEIHLELNLYFINEKAAYQCLELINDYINTLIQQNEICSAINFYDKIRMIKDYAKNKLSSYLDCLSMSYINSPGQFDDI